MLNIMDTIILYQIRTNVNSPVPDVMATRHVPIQLVHLNVPATLVLLEMARFAKVSCFVMLS